MPVRTAVIRLVDVDGLGNIVHRNKATIAQVTKNINNTHKVFKYQQDSAPNASNNNDITAPSIHEYLNLESGDGFKLVHIDQFLIITSDD